MYRDHTVGVVVPAYNEEGFVGKVIEAMPAYVDRIYVVDDGSTDGTWGEITSYVDTPLDASEARLDVAEQSRTVTARSARDARGTSGRSTADGGLTDGGVSLGSRIVPIQHEVNRGAGAAIKTGYLYALQDGIDVTATVDADGQMNLDLLDQLLDPIVLDIADYTKGNRLLNPSYWEEMPRFRFAGNMMLSFLTKVASGYWRSMDSQNGFTAISHDALAAIDVPSLYEYYGYCNEILVRLNVHGMRVADVPMPAQYGDEQSDIRYSGYIPKVSTMLLRNFLWRLQMKYLTLDFHPLAFLYLLGMVSAGLAGVFVLVALVAAVVAGGILVPIVSALVFLLLGAFFVVSAMLYDHSENAHLEVTVK